MVLTRSDNQHGDQAGFLAVTNGPRKAGYSAEADDPDYGCHSLSVLQTPCTLYLSVHNHLDLMAFKFFVILFATLQHFPRDCSLFCDSRASSTNLIPTSTTAPLASCLKKASIISTTGLMTEPGILWVVSLVAPFTQVCCLQVSLMYYCMMVCTGMHVELCSAPSS